MRIGNKHQQKSYRNVKIIKIHLFTRCWDKALSLPSSLAFREWCRELRRLVDFFWCRLVVVQYVLHQGAHPLIMPLRSSSQNKKESIGNTVPLEVVCNSPSPLESTCGIVKTCGSKDKLTHRSPLELAMFRRKGGT